MYRPRHTYNVTVLVFVCPYVHKTLSINTALAADPDAHLLGPFNSTDVDVEPLCIFKTVYLPAPFVRLFLEQDLTTVDVWTHIRSVINDGGIEAGCHPIIDWICVALAMKTGN